MTIDLFANPELMSRVSRYREIDLLSRVYEGTQYDGRADWWTGLHRKGGDEVPLRERKPCIIYRLPKAATQQVVRFLFGESRFPKIEFAETTSGDGYPDVNENDVATLTAWTTKLIESAKIQPFMRAIATKAVACKTAVVIIEAVDGQFRFTLPRPQDCYAEFANGDPCREVTRLVWCYEFEREILGKDGLPTSERAMFRREWDGANVYVYDDVKLKTDGSVTWGAPTVSAHGLSFCPVLWIRNEPEYASGIDGVSLYESLEDEFEALDMALSRRHQGIIYLGAPQLIETGVADDDGPDNTGRKASAGGYSAPGAEFKVAPKARRVAPDSVWTYQGENVDVKLLETSGKAFEVGTSHVNDIRSRVLETMGVVLTSMTDTVGRTSTGQEMSARFLQLAHAPLLALVGEYRTSWWTYGLKAILNMAMRMTHELQADGQRISIASTNAALPVLAKFAEGGFWTEPHMTPNWGRFFDQSSDEIKIDAESAALVKREALVSAKTATSYISHAFGVGSVDEELEEIEQSDPGFEQNLIRAGF